MKEKFLNNIQYQKDLKIQFLKNRLTQLSQDIIQYICGELIDDIEERKLEFISTHNELRELLGKEKRIFK